MRILRLFIILCIWAVPIAILCYWHNMPKYGSEELKDGQYSIKNNSLVWDLELTNGVLKSTRIRNTKTKEVLDLSGEDFSIKLGPTKDLGWIIKDGEQIFVSKTGKTITPEECQPLYIVREKNKTSLLFYYEPFQIILNLEFAHDPKENFIRRSISLTSCYDKELVVEEVVLGDWSIDYTAQGGGKGLPAFVNDKWFLSGEEPWFETKVSPNHILLAHHPSGYLNKGGSWTTDSTIIGGGSEDAKTILKDYVRSVMLPPKFFSLYNTWYDIRNEDLTADNVVLNFMDLQRRLDPYGASIDYCVIDDGWFDKDTLYEADTNTFPKGLKEVSDTIAFSHSKLGLWLPYSGLYLDNKTLREKYPFEEASSQFFCLSGTNYFSALSKRLEEVIKEDRVSFFKHDFNYFNCTMPRHGHLRNIYQGAEANMRRTAELLDLERKTDPEVIQALTTGINLSPWWLKYAHILWMGGGDVDYSANHPVTTRSAAEMTYRDGLLYHLLKEKEIFFPLYALMTHGIIDGKLNSVVPWVTNSQWADYVMNYMGRGTAIRELFIYYPKLDEKKSEILAKALNWADEHNAQMRNSEMILGNPNKNEVYGFRGHDDQGNVYASIRNPKLTDEEVAITDLGIESEYYRVSYPYHKVCEAKTLPRLQIPAESVLIIESLQALTQPTVINARADQNLITFDEPSSVPVFLYSKDNLGLTAKKVNKNLWQLDNSNQISIPTTVQTAQVQYSSNGFSFDLNIPDNATADLVITIPSRKAALKLTDNQKNLAETRKPKFDNASWNTYVYTLQSGKHVIEGEDTENIYTDIKLDIHLRVNLPLPQMAVKADATQTSKTDPCAVSQNVLKKTYTIE